MAQTKGARQIYDAETGALLSRKDAYLPTNMFFDGEAASADIARWEEVAEERRKSELSGG